MTKTTKGRTPDAAAVNAAAAGRWMDILPAAGIAAELLDGRGHPCPRCGGDDRFAAMKDVAERGAVLCRGCFAKGGGDGLATVQWIRGIDFPAAVRFVADYLHITPQGQAHAGNGQRRVVATYSYRDAAGNLVYQTVRYEPKDFRQRRPKPGGGWLWNLQGIDPLPYRLPELLAADTSRPVAVVEGEKDADSLAAAGMVATCNHGGAGKWTAAHARHLAGRRAAIIPDADEPGERHAQAVAASLRGIAASVRIVRLPTGKDVSDWLQAGGTPERLAELIDAAPEWTPAAGPASCAATPAPWPELDALTETTLPDFPLQALPGILQDWTAAESYATQTPPDLAGLLALAVHASCIARHVDIEPQPGWREPVNLFVAVLLEPGNRKSAVFSDATQPLRQAEAAVIEATRPTVAREQSERRQMTKRLERLEKLAADKGDTEAAREAGELAERLALTPEPVLPRLVADDATNERLGMLLAEQGGRIASMSPEGGVFDLMAGLYSKSGMPQFGVYLMGHAGDDLRVDRVSRKAVHVERPALTCAYAMQPQVVNGLASNAAFRGRGLLGRFLYAAPRSWIGKREIRPAPVSAVVADAYAARIRELAADPPQGTLNLAGDAARLFYEWQAEIETMLANGGELEAIRDWGGKLAGATARLAAVLHCAEHPDAMRWGIGSDTVRAAVQIGRYLIPHAETVLTMMAANDDTTADDARYVLQWIARHGRREFTKRQAYQDCKRRFRKADDIDPALGELARRGYIRPKPQDATGPGRPPSPGYEVNPAVFDFENAEKRPHNPQNSNCGDCGDGFGHFAAQNQAGDEWGEV